MHWQSQPRLAFVDLSCCMLALGFAEEKYYQAMEKYDPQWTRPSKKGGGRGKKRAASDDDDGSSPGSESSDEDAAPRASFVSERPKRRYQACAGVASAQTRVISAERSHWTRRSFFDLSQAAAR